MNLRVTVLLLSAMIVGCNPAVVVSAEGVQHSEKSYVSSVVSRKSVSTGIILTLKVEEAIQGVEREDNVIIKISKDDPLFLVSENNPYLFVKEKPGSPGYRNIFYVYDVAPDRYSAIRKQFEKLNIEYYTDDFSKEILWVPVSCNIDISTCQHEINIIAGEYARRR